MAVPRYTVIIPVLQFRIDEPVLASLRETPPPSGGVQILVSEGCHPARQRNAAEAHTEGEIVVFLDNDCLLAPGFWEELETAFACPEVDIVGGPALLRPQAPALERIFHALLTHTLIVGTVSARYAPSGLFRRANQTELILCNLSVRRSVFEKIGPLSTDLYPNEENEWLDRAHAAGAGIYYDPALRVFRPQRSQWGQMGRMLIRYGMGRTRQFMVSGWHPTFHQFLPVMAVATFVALFHWHLEREFVILWLTASGIIAFTCDSRLTLRERLVAGLAAPLVPLVYTVGQVLGWFDLLFPVAPASSAIALFNEKGERLP